MESMRKILKESGLKALGEHCADRLISKGYIKTKAFGWEKPEILERFGLKPNAEAIPAQEYDKYTVVERKMKEKDDRGNATGQYIIARERVATGEKFLAPTQNYFDYREFKKKQEKQNFAKKINTPPIQGPLI